MSERFAPVPYAALAIVGADGRLAVLDLYTRAHTAGWRSFCASERDLMATWGLDQRRVSAILGALSGAGMIVVERAKWAPTRITVHNPCIDVPVAAGRVAEPAAGTTSLDSGSSSSSVAGAASGRVAEPLEIGRARRTEPNRTEEDRERENARARDPQPEAPRLKTRGPSRTPSQPEASERPASTATTPTLTSSASTSGASAPAAAGSSAQPAPPTSPAWTTSAGTTPTGSGEAEACCAALEDLARRADPEHWPIGRTLPRGDQTAIRALVRGGVVEADFVLVAAWLAASGDREATFCRDEKYAWKTLCNERWPARLAFAREWDARGRVDAKATGPPSRAGSMLDLLRQTIAEEQPTTETTDVITH